MRILFALLLFLPVALHAQVARQTYVVEAHNCGCGETPTPTNSIQLGVRLDHSTTVYTALNTLAGCSRLYLNVDGVFFLMRITLANARDNIARLEPIEMAVNITELEKKMRNAPKYAVITPGMEATAQPVVMILQGADMSMKKRGLINVQMQAEHANGNLRYRFTMPKQAETDIDFDKLLGGPVWIEKGKDHLAGIITGLKESDDGVDLVVTGVENILDKGRYQLYYAYLADYSQELADCRGRQVYWDGFGTYKYRVPEKPQYHRLKKEKKWDKLLRVALVRVLAHMRDNIPSTGGNREGTPSLCVFVNDLENVYMAFVEQASATERENWQVLPRFVKAYGSVYCKQRQLDKSGFAGDIIELNACLDRISGDELRLLYELGYNYYDFDGFVKRYFLESQISGIRRRYEGIMLRTEELKDPCMQRLMLEDLNELVGSWTRHVGLPNDPNFKQLLQYRREIATLRDSYIAIRTEALNTTEEAMPELLQGIESDTCLTSTERMNLLKAAQGRSVDHEHKELEYGLDVVEGVRSTIGAAFGESALANVTTRIFRVENGVGIELTVRGGGADLNKRLYGHAGDASDTTTVYRSGFPLGSVGDTLSATIAQVFWERICEDYSSKRWAFRTESVQIIGMADGVPVRSTIRFAEACNQALAVEGLNDPNEQLAYARAWSLNQQIMNADRCGLYELLTPVMSYRIHQEKGGEYRGVVIRAVMRWKK